MIQSDMLSRLQHLNLEDNDNDDMILLPDKLFISTVDTALNERIKDIHAKDQIVLDALRLPFPRVGCSMGLMGP